MLPFQVSELASYSWIKGKGSPVNPVEDKTHALGLRKIYTEIITLTINENDTMTVIICSTHLCLLVLAHHCTIAV